ncbi:16S rRNA (adenine(1518)-N(6)/adenine(1519)-N(6))-dimethyltransferase RsmA [uncultured Parasphingorhabdus sp.]|uniref:16S rRNA (adenine(1518)-N(6)/adenine(1519)-N(6))- dimethyltransferase RsmA n=1 Tax=uncultured Parasphingorhabdus sp. TaxID=2709694 RepID=UPI002AA90739|nr:16S rRNA (adenine(1518)-N(6)/adenine(1519)-N(6))-dimethyltransferase RsmA [uncultured Parasphingorhabdus sp.]
MNQPAALPPLREVIRKHGLTASKALGQNFLFDMQLLDRIAAVPGSLDGQSVFEVGPGPGGLTRALLQAGAQVTAVERDERCLPALSELSGHFPDKLTLINDDALALDHGSLFEGPFHILSNLPYNVGSALLVKWLSAPQWPPQWQSLTLMFQREVADRIVAEPGSSAYGRLSILAQWRSTAKLAMTVHRSAFTPPPKVMSAVVHITPAAQPEGVDFAKLEVLTQTAFSQRRKMLRQSLKKLPGGLEALEQAGIDSQRRPETLAVSEFVELARRLS